MHVALLAKWHLFTDRASGLFSIPLEPRAPPHARTVEKCMLIILRDTKVTTVPPVLAKYRITSPSSLNNAKGTVPSLIRSL